ncbi:hypothetical protein ASE14_11255 [Agromyces sp. Root81]|nr:hypothetical protein ASE14_11255 [Agromyces sp. Root81]
MNLQDRYDECTDRVAAIDNVLSLLPRSPSAVGVLTALGTLEDLARTWTGDHLLRPGGSPDSVQRSAESYEDVAEELDAQATALEGRASDVEAGLDAAAGRTAATRVRAFIGLAGLEARGIRVIADALKAYADELDDGQSRFDRHAAGMRSARGDAFTVSAPPADWDDSHCAATMIALHNVYDEARAALIACRDALGTVIEAERRLRFAFTDASGYARLCGLPTSRTVNIVDGILALADGIGDPDRAVVSHDEWVAYLAARDELSEAERKRLDAALDTAEAPDERQIIIAALATGAGLALTLALALKLRTMTQKQIQAVAGLGLPEITNEDAAEWSSLTTPDGTVVTQMTNTTCGSSSLLMLAAQRDPFLALLIAEGEFVDGYVPDYVSDVTLIDRLPEAGLTSAERLRFLQEEIRIQTNKFTLWPGTWLGSAPWGYGDEVSRILDADVDLEYSLIGPDSDAQALIGRAITAVDSGTPVPFLVGDDTGVPRHYVLLVGHNGDELQFYEPWEGEVRTVPIDEAASGAPQGAYGWWKSIYGAAVPAD